MIFEVRSNVVVLLCHVRVMSVQADYTIESFPIRVDSSVVSLTSVQLMGYLSVAYGLSWRICNQKVAISRLAFAVFHVLFI